MHIIMPYAVTMSCEDGALQLLPMQPPMDHPARSSGKMSEVQELVHLEASSGDSGDTPLLSSSPTYLLTDKDRNGVG